MIWNLLDDNKIKAVFDKFLPKLQVAKRVLVPKLDTVITLENIESLPLLDKWSDIKSDETFIEGSEVDWTTQSQFRILSEKTLKQDQDTLLIHVHGGGFISMSSGSH